MILSAQERQAWFDHLQAQSLEPDTTPVNGSRGRVFRRTRELVCPVCGVLFFAYQCDQEPIPPRHNPEPPIHHGVSTGRRETCSHPLCTQAEIKHQQERPGTAYERMLHGGMTAGATPEQKPKRQPAGAYA